MKKFMITFRMIELFPDYANTPTEYMMIESPCNMTATMEFCNHMEGERFVIDDVKEIENEIN